MASATMKEIASARRLIMDIISSSCDILYIDDDEVDIENVQREFKKIHNSLRVVIARDGVEALNKLYGRNGEEELNPAPKLILLDLNMPKMNGVEFLKTLRDDPHSSSISVYILAGSFNTQTKLTMKDLNVAGCIIKPLEYIDAFNVYWALFH